MAIRSVTAAAWESMVIYDADSTDYKALAQKLETGKGLWRQAAVDAQAERDTAKVKQGELEAEKKQLEKEITKLKNDMQSERDGYHWRCAKEVGKKEAKDEEIDRNWQQQKEIRGKGGWNGGGGWNGSGYGRGGASGSRDGRQGGWNSGGQKWDSDAKWSEEGVKEKQGEAPQREADEAEGSQGKRPRV